MVTLKDVARECGHSLTTTASILRGEVDRFSDGTVRRVRETAARIGYVPNLFSRNLKMGRSGTVIFLVAGKVGQSTVDPRILSGLVDRAAEADVKVIVERISVEDAFDNPEAPFKTHRYYDGMILNFHSFGAHSFAELEATINRFGVPVTWFNAKCPENAVYVDERAAARDLARALLAQGRRRFLYVGLHPDNPHYSSRDRFEGFRAEVEGAASGEFRSVLLRPEDFGTGDDSRFRAEIAAFAAAGFPADAVVFSHPAYATALPPSPRHGGFPPLYAFDVADPRLGEAALPGSCNDWAGMSRAALDHLLVRIGGDEASIKAPSVEWRATLRMDSAPVP